MRNGLEIVHSRSGHGFYRQPFLAKTACCLPYWAHDAHTSLLILLIGVQNFVVSYIPAECKEKQISLW
jgi:hypothetical protein